MTRPIRLAITSGDPDGVGFEVCAKALRKVGPQKNVQIFLWRSAHSPTQHLHWIDRRFQRLQANSWPKALEVATGNPKQIIEVISRQSPAHWFETSVQACMSYQLDAIATAPMSKKWAGKNKTQGHTDILRKALPNRDLFMCFIGSEFSLLLVSDHIPIKKIIGSLSKEKYKKALVASRALKELLPAAKKKKPVAFLGINPHAGEQGRISKEEQELLLPFYKMKSFSDLQLSGPLPADSAFVNQKYKKYSVILAHYHDQGLIPFKMIHGQNRGIQITMGLPFVRTSVDHGTAKDIFGRNKADEGSMIEAINWAIKLARRQLNNTKRGRV